VIFFRGIAEGIQHGPGLRPPELSVRIDLEHFIHVLGKIHHHRYIAALAGEARAAAARKYWSVMSAACSYNGLHIGGTSGASNADRDLPVIGAIRRIKRSRARVETDFSLNCRAQLRFECGGRS